MHHSPELKEAVLRRLLPPNNEPITKVSREEGIPQMRSLLPQRLKYSEFGCMVETLFPSPKETTYNHVLMGSTRL